AYLALMLLSPYLNKIIDHLDDETYKKFLIVFTLVSPLYSTLGDTRQTLCDLSIGVYYFFLWGYLRRHPNNWFERNRGKIFCGVLLLSVLAASLSSYLFSKMGKQAVGLFSIFGRASIIQVILAVSLFYIFKNWEIGSRKWINILAQGMLGVYLIHENQLLYPFLWNWVILIRKYFFDSVHFPIHLVGNVLLVFLLCTILDLARLYLLEKPLARLLRPIDTLFDKFDSWLAKDET
ncbi:MAG: hypothetical protein IJ091_07015, partial [Oscillospiraceae bacterium]|nr:hypothetical protein [Oscillospiraceae bacterium]